MTMHMTATLADIIKVMESLAPSRLAEGWDNVGMQIGDPNWPVQTIRVALDPTHDVVAAAVKDGADLLITHHPLIFRPIKSIDFGNPLGGIIQTAIQHRMAIFSAHTNLDNAIGGLNDILASRIGLNDLKVLGNGNVKQTEKYKLVIYVPEAYQQTVMTALFETKAGEIGTYSCCSFWNKGEGTFKPGPLSKPFSGKIGEIFHSYDAIQGPGRIGKLDKSMDLKTFASSIKRKIGLDHLKVAGHPDLPIETVAVCSGSGSGLISQFISSGAQVYVSGDLGYHDAKTVEALNLGLIDIGHFASEHLIVDVLTQRLKQILSETGMDIKVEASKLEHEPFMIL
ncbi:MAG: Nif3-like dinuclear metal center hexameric protein [Desulfobacterales bacterium]